MAEIVAIVSRNASNKAAKKLYKRLAEKSVYWADSLDPAMEQAVVNMAIAQPSFWVTKRLQSA